MYQHPEYQVDKSLWFYQVWSLMMVLSEIPEWRPLDGEGQDKAELLKKKWERKRLVMSPSIPARFDKMTQQNGRE
ncbi:hypothetical protein NKR23_g11788 [Pleurostoma richardsiae]|uniref:Uncharacterized protein n=1 Tax=Pleurostoma richardsiae TaxID=41990 RepID=A0AA38VGG4_9PEZI|nr:hypothetical protein NKR23_g11788 [Pleurostoma richardsiae]